MSEIKVIPVLPLRDIVVHGNGLVESLVSEDVEDGSKSFLFDDLHPRIGANDGRLDKVTKAIHFRAATNDRSPILLGLLDCREHLLHGFLVDQRSQEDARL